MCCQGDLRRPGDFGKAHTAYSDFTSVLPHTTDLLCATAWAQGLLRPVPRDCVGGRAASLRAARSPRLRRRRGASLTAPLPLRLRLVRRQPELRQGDVIVQLLEDYLDA